MSLEEVCVEGHATLYDLASSPSNMDAFKHDNINKIKSQSHSHDSSTADCKKISELGKKISRDYNCAV